MNLVELFNKNYSRKAAVAVCTIVAIYLIATSNVEEGAKPDQTIAKWAIGAIFLIGALSIFAQAVNDWLNPRQEPEPPTDGFGP